MAQVSFENIKNYENRSNGENLFSFFSLRNDGDKALVRILYNNPSEFKMVTYHPERIEGKQVNVSCLRDYDDPVSNCPLCAGGRNTVTRIYIPMVQYFNDNGNVTTKLVLWERSLAYARTLSSLIDEYGPLSDMLFTIKRSGAAGSKDTTYDILPSSPKMYPDGLYPLPADALQKTAEFNVIGTIVKDKSFDEMMDYLHTGSFPMSSNKNANTMQTTTSLPNIPPAPPEISNQPSYNPQQFAPSTVSVPQGNYVNTNNVDASQTNRPRRYY